MRPGRALRHGIRRGFARVAAAILGWFSRPPALTQSPERILVLRIDERVGNVLLTTPLITALREAFPRAELDLLAAASKVSLVRGLVSTIPFEKRTFFRAPLRFFSQLRALRARRYDVVIDASHWHEFSLSSALLLGFTGAPARIAHDRGEARRFATHLALPPPSVEPEVRTKLRLLAPLGIEVTRGRLTTSLGATPEASAAIRRWLETAPLTRPIVGLAPGARKLNHRLPPEVFAGIGRAAAQAGASLLVLWGPGEEALAEDLAARCGAVLAPPTDLAELAALMRACDVIVANDTGPMHLAVATGAPTIALFAQADHGRWGHAEPPNVVIAAHDRPPEAVIEEASEALRNTLSLRLSS